MNAAQQAPLRLLHHQRQISGLEGLSRPKCSLMSVTGLRPAGWRRNLIFRSARMLTNARTIYQYVVGLRRQRFQVAVGGLIRLQPKGL